MRRDLPSGTVTFLFTDVEKSTTLLHELGAQRYASALAEHRRILRQAFTAHGGVEVDTQGDAFFVVFTAAPEALSAAAEAQEQLATGPLRVRMGLHTGTPYVAEEGYVGVDVHRAARIAACGHGGQVLVSADTAGLVPAEVLRDLGLHRLKDLSAPEHIYQLGQARFPPLRSLYRTNLPIPATPFVGRQKELFEVVDLLSGKDVRLLTLTGPGGTGKTRLAIQAAAELAERYPHGMWWVPLAPLRDPKLVLETAATILGAKSGLAEHIADRPMLLLLDNFEQVVEAAAEIAALLSACPHLDVLVTSREPLRLRSEQQYLVQPMAADEAVALFLARARALKRDFRADPAISEICRRLDDLPLALELAAARVKALSPRQILERLERRLSLLTSAARDLPERQRTLRAAIAWSYDLLEADEQRLFARLAVFRAGATLVFAEAVAGADIDTLQSLVDKSLVRYRDERFVMLETIREYATERLDASTDAGTLRRRHADHYLALVEQAEPHLWEGDPSGWLDRLDAEHDNLRAALDEFEAEGETELALRLAGGLWRFWNLRGHTAEGMRRVTSLLASDERPTAGRARALTGAAAMASLIGDNRTARIRAEEALALHLAHGDAHGAALARSYLATAATGERDWATARQLGEENVLAYRAIGDEDTAILQTWQLAWTYRELGDRERSRALLEENLRRARALGNKRVEAMSLGALGTLAVDAGNIADGLGRLEGAYRISCDIGARVLIAVDLCRLARAMLVAGWAARAVTLLAKAEALSREIGLSPSSYSMVEARTDETLAAARARLDASAFARAWDRGRALALDEVVALALTRDD